MPSTPSTFLRQSVTAALRPRPRTATRTMMRSPSGPVIAICRPSGRSPYTTSTPTLAALAAVSPRRPGQSQSRATGPECRGPQRTATSRHYHSHDHPPPPGPFSADEQAILAAAYAHVPEHGFTPQVLVRGARDAGYRDISTNFLPDGVFGLIRWHLATRREALAARSREIFGEEGDRNDVTDLDPKLSPVAQRAERLTWERLLGNREVIHRWQEALAIMAQPSYVPASLHELALLADEIWFLADGSARADPDLDSPATATAASSPAWYGRRASLAATYAATELFMTDDRSPGFADTRAFLRRRLGETRDVAGTLRSASQWVGFTASAGLNVLRSKGARI